MENTYSVSTFIKNNGANHKRALIYLRITVNGHRAEISIKRSVDPARWDSINNRMKGKMEDAKAVNSLLNLMIIKINKIYNDIVRNEETITAAKIKEIFLGKSEKKKSLLETFALHNKMMCDRVGIDFSKSTLIRYRTTYDHIVQFLKQHYNLNDIPLGELQYSFITNFEHFLKVIRKCNHNSTQKYIRNFRKIVNNAIKNDWLDKDPFKGYRVKLKDTKRVFLAKEELSALEGLQLPISRLEQVRDIFIFCCYTGLSYVDVEKLSTKEIVKGHDGEFWLVIDRTKTGNPSNVPLLPKALTIISRYKDHPQVLHNGKLLPVISNQRMNGYLKELAVLARIEKKLTFHAARHTFATTVTLSNGTPIETVSALLGHKNFKTTQIYAKVVQQKISDDMKRLKTLLTQSETDNKLIPTS